MNNEGTVFIVDDDLAVREATQFLVESIGLNVKTHPSADHFLENYQGESGCLVMDVRMPGLSGLDAQDELLKRNITLPIIFITGHGDVPMAVRALKSGATEFLEKPFNDQVLLDCIQNALKQADEDRKQAEHQGSVQQKLDQLTPREQEVLRGVVEGKPNKVIALDLNVSIKTVEVHRARMMDKMGAESVADLVRMSLLVTEGA